MTPDKDEQARILTKVRKMLALAADAAASEGERDNALRMAHAILARYNLTMAQVELSGVERTRDTMDDSEDWVIRIASPLARLFFCSHYFQRTRPEGAGTAWTVRHSFIGQPANVTTALLMLRYVVDSIRAESPKGATRAIALSFASGAAIAIAQRCAELTKRGPEGDAVPGTAVVLADYYRREATANAEWLRSQGTRLTTGHVGLNASARDAFNAGKSYGKSLSLNPQVAGNAPGTLALPRGR